MFLASAWLTGRMRSYALARRILDLPNARSSHSVATPRGGGMAIAVLTVAAVPVLGWLHLLASRDALAIVVGGAFIAGIGFLDDHDHVPARWRLMAHFAAAAFVLWCVGGYPPRVQGSGLLMALILAGIGLLAVVWLVNLTNFMDGIDGLAGTEAVTVCVAGAFLPVALPEAQAVWMAPVLVAAASAGFLTWNWPPARIFMGDGGSGFVGLMFGVFALQAARVSPALLWGWAILLGAFTVDATLTLLRRGLRGEMVAQPHRSHAYQHAARRVSSHRPVTVAVAVINVIWLWPLALMVVRGLLDGPVGLAAAYAPLVVAGLWLGAGVPDAGRRPSRLDTI
jgi:Fuc2NAc and GlcNAc transferase